MIKKVFILGASSDIGVETTKLFLNKGWEVVAHYHLNSKKLIKPLNGSTHAHYTYSQIFQIEIKHQRYATYLM